MLNSSDLKKVGVIFSSEGNIEFKKTLQEVNLEMNKNYNQFKLTQAQWDSSTSKTTKLKAQIDYLSNAYEIQEDKAKILREQLEELENAENKDTEAIKKKRAELLNAESKMATYQNKIKDLNNQLNDSGKKFTEWGKKVEDAGGKIENAGKKMMGVTTAITTLGSGTVATAANFEDSMRQVAATMGITAGEIENGSEAYTILENAAKECGENTKYSASEAAQALNYLALAGYDAQKSAETLPKILNLAAAGNLDLATASDMVTDAMAALGMESKDLDKYIDKMAKTSQKSNTSVAQLGEATLTCAGTVKTAGMSLETMNAELGILANNGIKGAEGGTHLRNIILSLTSPTDNAAKAMKDLGIKVADSQGNIRDMNDIMSDFNKKLDGMSDEKKTNIISTIFNKTDISAVNALIKGSGEEFANLKNEISNCDGTAQDMADTMNSSLKGQLTLVKSQIEGIAIKIGNKLMPTVKNIVKKISEWADKFSKLNDEQVNTIMKIGAIVAAIGPVLIILGKLVTVIGTTTKALGTVKTAIDVVKGVTKSTSIAVNGLSVVFGTITSPVGLVTTAIVALTAATAIYAKHQADEITGLNGLSKEIDKQKESWEKLKEAREEQLEDSVTEINHLEDLKEELSKITDENGKVRIGYENRANVIVNQLNSALGTEIKLNGDIIENYQDMQSEIVKLIEQKKAEALLSVYADEYAEAMKVQTEATKRLIELKQQFKEKSSDLVTATGKERAELELTTATIAQKIGEESELISQYGYTIQNYEKLQEASVSGSAEAIEEATQKMGVSWDSAKIQVSESLEDQIKSEQEYVDALKSSLQDAKTANDEYQEYIIQKQLDSANERLKNLEKELNDTSTTIDINKAIETANKKLAERSTRKYNTVFDEMSDDTNTELKATAATINNYNGVEIATGNMAKNATSDFAKNSKIEEETKQDLADTADTLNKDTSVENESSGVASRMTTKFNNVADGQSAGKNFVRGVNNGLNDKTETDNVINSSGSLASRLLSKFKNVLGIHSPSKEAEEAAEYFLEGFIAGITGKQGDAIDSVENLAKNINDEFSGGLNANYNSYTKSSNNSNNNGIDYSKLTNAFLTALNKCKLTLDEDGFARIVKDELYKVV